MAMQKAKKRVLLTGGAIFSVLVVIAVGWWAHPDLPMRFDYQVNPTGTITLIRPDVPERRSILLGFVQLPVSCWQDATDWDVGQWGRISFGKDTCRIERHTRWDPQETAAHYARVAEREVRKK